MTSQTIKTTSTRPGLQFSNQEWQPVVLGEVLERSVSPINVSSGETYSEIGVRSHGRGIFHKDPVLGSVIGDKRVFRVIPDALVLNIVFAWEQAVAKTSKGEDGMIASHRFPMYVPKPDKLSLAFIYYLFMTKKGKYLLELASPGGAGRNKTLGQKNFEELTVYVPSVEEQVRIAEVLSSLDDRIRQTQLKVDLLQQYKSTIAKALFSQEFSFSREGDDDFAEWTDTTLGQIAVRVTDKNRNGVFTRVLTNSATRGIIDQNEYFDKNIANPGNLENYSVVNRDDFVYNPRISVSAPVGPMKRNHKGDGVMSPLYSVLRFNTGNLDYLEQYFKTSLWHGYMKSVANYGARHDRMNISAKQLLALPIPFPSAKEQVYIAGFLTTLDDKIRLTREELVKANKYKSALLQKLFI